MTIGGAAVGKFDITLVGEFNLDLLLYGLPEALPLERELLADRMTISLGGSPAITAHNLARLGSRVGLIACSSDDMFGRMCLAELDAAEVNVSRLVSAKSGHATGVTVLLQHESSRRAFTYPGTTAVLQYEDLDLEYLRSASHFHLSSPFLQESLLPDLPRLFAELKQAGLTISLDPNDDPTGRWDGPVQECLRYVDILMPNEREACALASQPLLENAVSSLVSRVPLLVVKRGARGATAFASDQRESVDAVKVESVDAVGAGDSFNAGFLHGFVRHWPLRRCLEFGNRAGALSTTAAGGTAAFRDPAAMQAFFARHSADEAIQAGRRSRVTS